MTFSATNVVSPGRGDEPTTVPCEPFDPGVVADRQLEVARIRLEVVGHLVLGGEVPVLTGDLHAREAVRPVRCEQRQGIPAVPPGVAGACVRVDDEERQVPLGQLAADSQTGLPASDDKRACLFARVHDVSTSFSRGATAAA